MTRSMQLPRTPFMTALFDRTSWSTKSTWLLLSHSISPYRHACTLFCVFILYLCEWLTWPFGKVLWLIYWNAIPFFCGTLYHWKCFFFFIKLFDLYSASVFILPYVAKCLPSTDCEWVGISVIKKDHLKNNHVHKVICIDTFV